MWMRTWKPVFSLPPIINHLITESLSKYEVNFLIIQNSPKQLEITWPNLAARRLPNFGTRYMAVFLTDFDTYNITASLYPQDPGHLIRREKWSQKEVRASSKGCTWQCENNSPCLLFAPQGQNPRKNPRRHSRRNPRRNPNKKSSWNARRNARSKSDATIHTKIDTRNHVQVQAKEIHKAAYIRASQNISKKAATGPCSQGHPKTLRWHAPDHGLAWPI